MNTTEPSGYRLPAYPIPYSITHTVSQEGTTPFLHSILPINASVGSIAKLRNIVKDNHMEERQKQLQSNAFSDMKTEK